MKNYSQDVGVAASLVKTLLYYAAGSGDAQARTTGERLLNALSANSDTKGIAVPETRSDYNPVLGVGGDRHRVRRTRSTLRLRGTR